MDILKLVTNFYRWQYDRWGLPYWVMTPLRRITRVITNKVLPRYLAKSQRIKYTKEVDVIVSMTSFPARIDNVWQVVECMLRQTYRPRKIILWLSKDQYPSLKYVPNSLISRLSEIFEIRLVDDDIRSHKKYQYVSREYSNSLIFLIDDDIYYSPTIIERTIKEAEKHPRSIICNYACKVTYKDFCAQPYNLWKRVVKNDASSDLFFGSGGGTLFCPKWMYPDLTNIELAMTLTPTADDIWLNAMARLMFVPIIYISSGPLLSIKNKVNECLCSINNGQGKNDEQIEKLNNYYSDRFQRKVF